jgi:hypothetical protein
MSRDFNIYCDESRYSNDEDPFLVIGAVKCPRDRKRDLVHDLDELKWGQGVGGEFGWKTASQSRGGFYRAVIDWFLAEDDLRFRCVVANKGSLWSHDDEDGFYVVYHQLLCHWLVGDNTYHVYLDEKRNSKRWQVDVLKRKTEEYMPKTCSLACVEEVRSRECVLVQLADFLIGCMGYAWNGHADLGKYPGGSTFKRDLCAHLAKGLGRPTLRFSTWASETKFNVFRFGE